MRRAAPAVAALILLGAGGAARADVEYRVDLDGRQAHHAEITMTVRNAQAPLELTMPVWTPGAYEVRTWGRNVTPLDGESRGQPVRFRRTGPSSFRVEGHQAGAEVRLRYRVYAPNLSDDASQIDGAHAYLNGTSMFLRARGADDAFHRVHIAAPAGWRVASALDETPAGALGARGYEALIDAPIEVGRFADGETHAAGRSYRVVLDGAREVPAALLRDLQAIADAEAKMVGAPPYQRYLLLVHLSDGLGRVAALEHAASASVVVPQRTLPPNGSGGDAYEELLYVIAHELFHAWNARRLRPAELERYDLSRPQPSRSLWFTEGVTEYYAHRTMHVTGRWSRARYLDRLGEEATRAVQGARLGLTLEEDAELAWQPPDDAAGDPDAYYARGHLVALALDAAIRVQTGGARSLDDVMRALLEQADRKGGVLPVDAAAVAREVAKVAGPEVAKAVSDWTQVPNEPARLGAQLAKIGVTLALEEGAARTIAGFAAELDDGALRVVAVQPDGPAAHAGLRAGDRILLFDGAQPTRKWTDLIAQRAPGARLIVEAVRAARRMEVPIELAAQRTVTARLVEPAVTPKIALLRSAWLP